MTGWGAFLRGVNLGRRQIRMAELKACLEDAGFAEVKTVLASGNVRLAADGEADAIRTQLEKAIRDRFGFPVGVVLRSTTELEAMLSGHPFGRLDPDADLTRHVLLFDQALPSDVDLADSPGDTEILRLDRREIYIACYRQPNGRYTEHVDEVLKPLYARLGKDALGTMRNWNTMEKMFR